MRIALANLKGGVGKTTSAVLLAEAATERLGSALLIDADPQGSAMAWADNAAEDGIGLRANTVALPTADLSRRLDGIARGYAAVVIDTPPGGLAIVEAAARAADVVVIPCQPTLMDLDRLRTTVDVVTEAGRAAVVVLTRVRAGTKAAAAARDALEEAELPVIGASIPQREALAAAYGTRPAGPALELYLPVFDELQQALDSMRRTPA